MTNTVKNVNGNYTINCDVEGGTPYGTFTVNAANIILTGTVTNTQPSVTVDAFITVGANNTGAVTDLGLIAQKTANTYAGLRFNSTANAWQISSSVDSLGAPLTAYQTISTSNVTVGGSNTQIQYNANGVFGGSANLVFDYANSVSSRLTLNGVGQYVHLGNASANLTSVANTALLFSNPAGSGGSGLYFVSPTASGELVSKAKAIVYSIIF